MIALGEYFNSDESGDDERKRGEEQRDAQRTGTRIEYRERDVTLDRIGPDDDRYFLGSGLGE